MVLYSADISNIAKPVKSVKNTKEPKEEPSLVLPLKKRIRKKVEKPEPVAEVVAEVVADVVESVPAPKTKKRKNVAKTPVPDVPTEPVSDQTIADIPKPKSKKKKIELVTPPPSPKKKKVFRDPTVPPLWFEKYIQGVKKEEAMIKEKKVPAKIVKQEASDAAQKSWDDGLTRDRVSNEVDNHSNYIFKLVNRMYSMIFARR